jgi:hypothetical protein
VSARFEVTVVLKVQVFLDELIWAYLRWLACCLLSEHISLHHINIHVALCNPRYLFCHFRWHIRLYNFGNLCLQAPLPPTEMIVLIQNDFSDILKKMYRKENMVFLFHRNRRSWLKMQLFALHMTGNIRGRIAAFIMYGVQLGTRFYAIVIAAVI